MDDPTRTSEAAPVIGETHWEMREDIDNGFLLLYELERLASGVEALIRGRHYSDARAMSAAADWLSVLSGGDLPRQDPCWDLTDDQLTAEPMVGVIIADTRWALDRCRNTYGILPVCPPQGYSSSMLLAHACTLGRPAREIPSPAGEYLYSVSSDALSLNRTTSVESDGERLTLDLALLVAEPDGSMIGWYVGDDACAMIRDPMSAPALAGDNELANIAFADEMDAVVAGDLNPLFEQVSVTRAGLLVEPEAANEVARDARSLLGEPREQMAHRHRR